MAGERAALAEGTRLGPYEVVSPIGAGGMGEVYRARDGRLGRLVAVKVLPSDLAFDPERRRRFEREARTVATLSHPNICTVFDVGREETPTGPVDYLVMEMLEGETLAQRLRKGPLPTEQVLKVGLEIASALDKAHRARVVHRDVKPGNILITKTGAKLLDFGLARLRPTATSSDGESTAVTEQPTRDDSLTDEGKAVGTYPYMAPEQLEGKAVDARADLFALGAVLYEMATGRRAFEGVSHASVAAAILTSEPPPITSFRPVAPKSLERLVKLLLAKDPDERVQSAYDVKLRLREIAEPGTGDPMAVTGKARPAWHWWAVTVALLALTATTSVWVAHRQWDRPLPSIKQLTFRQGLVGSARFTPEGKTVVYSAFWDGNPPEIFSTRVESPESRSLGLPPAQLMGVSSQGELAILLTRSGDLGWGQLGTLARVPLSGGAPRQVLDNVMAADWSPDGRDLAVIRQVDGELQLEYPIGKLLARPVVAAQLRVSPRGDRVAAASWGPPQVTVYEPAGKETIIRTAPHLIGFAWARDDAIWLTAGETISTLSLWRATLDGTTREVYRAPRSLVVLDASREGSVLVRHGFFQQEVRAKAPGDANERDLGVFTWSYANDLSADGTQLLVGEKTGTGTDIGTTYLQSTRGGTAVRLGEGRALALSPDAKWAILDSGEPGQPRLRVTPTGSGEPRALPAERFENVDSAWFIDAEHVVVHGSEPGRPLRAFLFDLSGGEARPVTPEGVYGIRRSRMDGSVIGWSAQGGALARFPLASGEPQPIAARLPSDAFPISVTADGRSIFICYGDMPLRVDRFELATSRVTPWKALRPDDVTGVLWVNPGDVTRDGDAYAYSYSRFLMDLYMIDGLR
jgi:eukaryotic-like serine/threonine-protein kinase